MQPGIRMASWLLHGSARGLEQFQGQQGWNAFSCLPNRPILPLLPQVAHYKADTGDPAKPEPFADRKSSVFFRLKVPLVTRV